MKKYAYLKFLGKESTHIDFGLNDIFYPGSDCELIDVSDLILMNDLIEKYGFEVIVAYSSIIRGCDPQSKTMFPNYNQAKKELKALIDKSKEFDFWDIKN